VDYYPKLLSAIPFTPVRGARLMAIDETARGALVAALRALQERNEVSSTHILYPRRNRRSSWPTPGSCCAAGCSSIGTMKGMAILRNSSTRWTARSARTSWPNGARWPSKACASARLRGAEITEAHWRFFNRCYRHTYAAHYSTPYLNLDFFRRIGETMPQHLLLTVALRG
jgi:predicted N-acyltransferase